MLTEESYQMAWMIYLAGGAGGLLCVHLWWFSGLGGRLRLTLALLLAVLIFTPTSSGEGVDTWAPAIVVGGFELLTDGPEAALKTLRPMGLLCLLALVPGLAWAFQRGRREKVSDAP